jgi:hypothetical protein
LSIRNDRTPPNPEARTSPLGREATAEYVAAMTGVLRELALRNNLRTLSYLLDMARLEAETAARTQADPDRSAPSGPEPEIS